MKLTNEFNSIIEWADERGILNNATVDTQFIKLQEEIGELAISILKKDESLFKDSIGDCVVVLTILAKLKNMSIEKGEAPDYYTGQASTILENAKAIPMQPAIERRREQLGLPKILEPDVAEVKKLLETTKLPEKLPKSSE